MDNSEYLLGSICLSDIPKEVIKDVNGKKYLNVMISSMREPKTYQNKNGGTRTLTHYMSCKPRPEEVVEGRNYYIGNFELKGRANKPYIPSPSDISSAPAATPSDDGLPF